MVFMPQAATMGITEPRYLPGVKLGEVGQVVGVQCLPGVKLGEVS